TISLSPTVFPHWSAFLESKDPVGITIAPLDEGWLLHSPPLALITESQLFGELPTLQHRVTHRKTDIHAMIRDLTELSIGAPVVHIRHGVGRYQGLQTIITDQHEAEYLTLQYAGDDKIYVPVSSLHLIHRYTGADAEHAPLQKLGSTQWDTIKKKTSQRIRDVAAELLAIYSQRAATPGYAFSPPDDHYHAFRRAFPFEETPDQTEAIENVIHDMIAPRSMDRVICGDVGFGKTEIAMQAAFLAVQNHKQVAVLVPTTLLAEQHWHNFQDRFVDWPVKIAAISRLRTLEERKQILRELSEGKIDILIGTHKLLHNDISFKDLGLLIIDEEHRFGVQQKERIKALRAHVDILMLTATPIPRTLNMALAGTRDLSIIATPPLRRLSIKTFVHEYTISLIREAILREILRGGQVYFLHNDVVSMPATLQKWEKIIPEARIQIAHGQMRERALERVMSDFYHQKFNVLLCTTIIESGIDIPTANTIIIDQAHHFGLAELHQLRGRVGRSHHQAYAYLFTPPQAVLTEEAKKRLDALTTLDTLGVGFQLATHDLEIRGAGELLGTEQSGHMHAVGFSLYLEWLNEAVEALKTGQTLSFEKSLSSGVDIDLGISALLPSDYVPDVHTRLLLYKKLAHCKDKKALEDFRAELIDRFGLIPKPAQYLLDYTEIQQIAAPLGIQKIEIGAHYGYFHFNESPTIQLSHLLRCISEQPDLYRLQQNNRLRFAIDTTDAEVRLSKVQQLLVLLA
ncbi:MAG: transcription-repair coupling factor, partial [Coxiella sp. RIFCSPHIGHO2_12_FULL_44_14]